MQLQLFFELLSDGVTVALQILVLPVQVRILVGQHAVPLCNGSTADSGSARRGSNPCGTTGAKNKKRLSYSGSLFCFIFQIKHYLWVYKLHNSFAI